MKTKRQCIFQGHEGTIPQYICTFNDCEVGCRWVCSDCLIEQLHNHGQPKQDHIMKQQQFIQFIIKQQETSKNNKELQTLQNLLKELEQLIFSTIILKNSVMNYLTKFTTYNIEQMVNVVKEDYLLLDNEQLQYIIHFNNIKYDQKLSQDQVAQIKQQNQQINSLIDMNNNQEKIILQKQKESNLKITLEKESQQKQPQQYKSNHHLKNNQIQLQESNQYDQIQFIQQQKQQEQEFQPSVIKIFELQCAQQNYQNYFEYKSDISIQCSQISFDEQYLVIVGFDKKIQVFDLKTKQNILCFYSQKQVNLCKFTLDSKQLLCTDDEGYLQQFDINKFKIMNSIKIHENLISDLLFINNHEIITCSADTSIQIRNIFTNQQIKLFKNAHKDFIFGIDYDFQKQIIFSCSKDNAIQLFDRNSGKLVFEKFNNNYLIQQIQVIPYQNTLISSSDSHINLWYIDYDKKQLIHTKVLSEQNYNFTSVLQNTCSVLICENYVKLLDNNLNIIKKIQHDIRELFTYFKTVQLDSTNYLIIVGIQQIQILKKL